MLRFSKKTKEESGEEDIGSIKKGIYMYFQFISGYLHICSKPFKVYKDFGLCRNEKDS